MTADPAATDGPGQQGTTEWSVSALVLAVFVFTLLFGQPVVVFALAVLSPGLSSLAVIVAGSALLAVPTGRVFLRQGGSVSRLGDFVLALAVVQILVVLTSRGLYTVVEPGETVSTAAQPVVVLVSYPVTYYVVYHLAPTRLQAV